MPDFLTNLTPNQRRVLLYGSAAVVLLVIGRRLTGGGPAPADTEPVEPALPTGTGSPQDAASAEPVVGTDAIAALAAQFTSALNDIRARLVTIGNAAPVVPTANLRTEKVARLWLYLMWLYGDQQPPAGSQSPYTADQLLAELYRRKRPKVNKHSNTAAGRAYRQYVDARESADVEAGRAPEPVAVGPTVPENPAPVGPAPARRGSAPRVPAPRPAPAPREPAPRPVPAPREPARRPAPPVTAQPDALVVRPSTIAAGASAYGTTRRVPRSSRGSTGNRMGK